MNELKKAVEKLDKNFKTVSTAIKKIKPVDFKVLENPKVYAFKVDEINEANNLYAVKVGDTARLVELRLNEWRKEYPTLKELAYIDAYIEIKNETTGYTERLYFRDHLVHAWLETKGYIPLIHSTKTKTVEKLGKEIVNPFNNGKISQEFYTYNGIGENVLTENIKNIEKIINKDTLEDFVNYVKENPEFLRKYFSAKGIKTNVSYRDNKPVDYAPFLYQKQAVKELVQKLMFKLENNKSNDTADIKVLLNSGTGSGKSNMLMWAAKAIYIQEQEPTLSVKQLYKKVFSPVQSGKINTKRTLTIATTAIPDVLLELQKTIETHVDFRNNYCYFSAQDVKNSTGQCIEDAYNGNLTDSNGKALPIFNNVVIGISLQNVSGRKETGELKEIHKILKKYEIDLVIGDEAHFAMFSGDVYKKAIKDNTEITIEERNELLKDLKEYNNEKNRELYTFKSRLGFMFASATVENLLLGNIFNLDNDVVYISQDTIDNQAWIENNKYINNLNETDSPFFGKPILNYFAISLDADVNSLFAVNKETGEFINNQAKEILNILFTGKIVENGELEDNLPRLISSETFQKAGAGRHVLISVSQKIIADAVEKYLESIKQEIINADNGKNVHIANISSTNSKNKFTKMNAAQIKEFIYDNRFDRTITITVSKLKVGVSVDQWDTIIALKGGSNISEREQFYGRGSRTWNEVVEFTDKNGNVISTEKFNMKPNTFIIDFNGDMIYEIENNRENTSDVLSNGSKKGKKKPNTFNDPFKKIINIKNGQLVELSREDVHAQLKIALERRTVSQLVERIPDYRFNIDEDFLDSVKIVKTGNKTSLRLTKEKEDGVQKGFAFGDSGIDGKVPEEFDDNKQSDNTIDETNEENNNNSTIDTEEEKREDVRRELQKVVNGNILIAGVILKYLGFNVANFNELYEFLYEPNIFNIEEIKEKALIVKGLENFNIDDFKNNIGLKPEYDFIVRKIYKKDKLVNFSISESLGALNVLAAEDDLGFIKVINGLSRISNNEILTPIEPINVPELVVSEINFSNLDNVLNSPISVINNADKTAIFQIETFNKIEKEFGLDIAKKAKYHSVPTSALSYEFIRAIYVKRGWDTDWIIWDDNSKLDCFKNDWAYAITLAIKYIHAGEFEKDFIKMAKFKKKIDKISNSNNSIDSDISRMALISFVKDRFMKDGELIKFDVCVSNPPYQDSNDNQIFNLFQETALIMSDQTSMVYPARWWYGTKSLNTFRNDLIKSGRLKNVLFYSNNVPLFENVEIAGGINIIYCNNNIAKSFSLKEIETGIEVSVDCDSFLNELYPIRPAFFKIVNKLDNFKKLTKIDKDTKLGLTGDKLKNIVIEKVDKNKKVKHSQLKIYANISGDKGGRADYYLADKDKLIKNGGNVVKGYKVLMRQAIIENENRRFTTFMVDNNTVYGRAAVGLGIFDKELEAKNFLSYCNTAFFEFVLRSNIAGRSKAFLSFVPDLAEVTNPRTNKIGWDSDWTDADLKVLFKDVLTDDDWKYIKKTAIKNDPIGFKNRKK